MRNGMRAQEVMRQTAIREGVSVETLRREMERAIRAGFENDDPEIHARWEKIPCKGDVPTPEELLEYLDACMRADTDVSL